MRLGGQLSYSQRGLPPTRGHGKVTFAATNGISMHMGNSPHARHVTTIALRSSIPLPHDYTLLRMQWMDKITDLVSGVPAKVPPFHTVNHEINLIDPDKQIHYWLLKCPDTLKEELAEKIRQYTSAGWWVPTTV